MFKLALGAGHTLNTTGKRISKELDPNETREWELNDRICDKIQQRLARYEGIEVLRVDDTNGLQPISVAARNTAANNWGADFALAIHHNAGVRGGSGGGIVAYRDPLATDEETVAWQSELYAALIRYTGLRGNRATPLAAASYQMLTGTKMPATLLELGFMDSIADVPIILTEKYADQCADAIVEVVARRAGLTLRTEAGPSPWAAEAAQWCVAEGIIGGDGRGNYGWQELITKEQAAVILHRFAKGRGLL